jgi:hypothetical protein
MRTRTQTQTRTRTRTNLVFDRAHSPFNAPVHRLWGVGHFGGSEQRRRGVVERAPLCLRHAHIAPIVSLKLGY